MKDVLAISKRLAEIGRSVYVVGSYNVHSILKKNFGSDIDLATPAKPEEIRSTLKVSGEIGAKYGTLIVKEGGHFYEITTFRKDIGSVNSRKPAEVIFTESLEQDASRRDFTFNAIYYDPLTETYTDPTGGIEDLKSGVIRFVGDPESRLDEDILRLLRYVRLKCKYGLRPSDDSYDAIMRRRVCELTNLSRDRIKQELDRMLSDKTNVLCLEELKNIGFFRIFFPQIDNLSRTPGGKTMHLEGDAWKHTLLSIGHLNHMKAHDPDLTWATLLHDVGKYPTYAYDTNGNIHYYDHESEGDAIFCEYISKVLPFSKHSFRKIRWLIRNHIRVGAISEMKPLKRNEFMSHEHFQALIQLYHADNLGKDPPDTSCGTDLQRMYDEFLRKFKAARFFTGSDIMTMHPELKGKEIGIRLKKENERILAEL